VIPKELKRIEKNLKDSKIVKTQLTVGSWGQKKIYGHSLLPLLLKNQRIRGTPLCLGA